MKKSKILSKIRSAPDDVRIVSNGYLYRLQRYSYNSWGFNRKWRYIEFCSFYSELSGDSYIFTTDSISKAREKRIKVIKAIQDEWKKMLPYEDVVL